MVQDATNEKIGSFFEKTFICYEQTRKKLEWFGHLMTINYQWWSFLPCFAQSTQKRKVMKRGVADGNKRWCNEPCSLYVMIMSRIRQGSRRLTRQLKLFALAENGVEFISHMSEKCFLLSYWNCISYISHYSLLYSSNKHNEFISIISIIPTHN